MSQRFLSEGERVTLRRSYLGIPAGTIGTVALRYLLTPGDYDVVFDGSPRLYVLSQNDLEPVNRPYYDNARCAVNEQGIALEA
jgi:hypothetical protein